MDRVAGVVEDLDVPTFLRKEAVRQPEE